MTRRRWTTHSVAWTTAIRLARALGREQLSATRTRPGMTTRKEICMKVVSTFAQHTGECAEGLWDSAMNDDANGSAAIRPSIPLANENDENGPPVDVQCLRVASRRISGSLGGHWARASLPVQNSFPTS
ncbi:hypothetical protein BJ912DRAFT_235225 [Pholiota molesta]|nr:hypothetical protein BJ912DRAFT_235225 [Pholiota molesta]